jgi:hypothetical protein
MDEKSENDQQQPEKKKDANDLLKGILGNALKTSMEFNAGNAGVETKKCKNCGAARPEDTDLQFCNYCGYKFY